MVRAQTSRSLPKSPAKFFLLTAIIFVPFPILATFVHVPGLPKNAPVTDFVAAFVPAVSALILTYRAEGRTGCRRLLGRVADYRQITKKRWYLPILLLPVACLAATHLLMIVTGIEFQSQPSLSLQAALLFTAIFFVAAIGEELGWSGYVFDPMQQRWGALGGSLLLGVIWWMFHIPSILLSGQGMTLVVLGAFGTVATRVLWCWIFNNTGGSVFAIVVVHTIANLCSAYVPSIPTSANAPVLVLLAILVAVLWGPRTLARFELKPVDSRDRRGVA